jgi:hypothetical protein
VHLSVGERKQIIAMHRSGDYGSGPTAATAIWQAFNGVDITARPVCRQTVCNVIAQWTAKGGTSCLSVRQVHDKACAQPLTKQQRRNRVPEPIRAIVDGLVQRKCTYTAAAIRDQVFLHTGADFSTRTCSRLRLDLGYSRKRTQTEKSEACPIMQARKMPSWPRSWANFSLLQLCSHRNALVNFHQILLGQPNSFLAAAPVQDGHARQGVPCGALYFHRRGARPSTCIARPSPG